MVTVSESLRCAISKQVSVLDDVITACQRITCVLQKDAREFSDHVTHVEADIQNYTRDQKQRVTDDAAVRYVVVVLLSFIYSLLF